MTPTSARGSAGRSGRRGRRGPRKASPEYLRRFALSYLERYATSAAHLRRLLLVKVERSARAHGTDPQAGAADVDSLIDELVGKRLLDDRAFAEAKAASLHRRGASARAIRTALAAKGVAPDPIAAALSRLEEETDAPELAAALTYARRRRLGPYRRASEREARRERDLAALGRRGFDLDLVRRVIDARDPAELEAEAGMG